MLVTLYPNTETKHCRSMFDYWLQGWMTNVCMHVCAVSASSSSLLWWWASPLVRQAFMAPTVSRSRGTAGKENAAEQPKSWCRQSSATASNCSSLPPYVSKNQESVLFCWCQFIKLCSTIIHSIRHTLQIVCKVLGRAVVKIQMLSYLICRWVTTKLAQVFQYFFPGFL